MSVYLHEEDVLQTGAVPTNTVAPAVTGTTTVGSVLTTTNGTWSNSPISYAYQWKRDAQGSGSYSSIGSATASTYTLVDADDACHIKCTVTATNGTGSTPADSNIVGTVTELVATNSVAPTISGSAPQGSTLTCNNNGTWTHMAGSNPTYTFQWTRAGTNIASATASTYKTVNADVGNAIRVKVTANNTGGASSAVASSNAVTPTTAGFHSGTLTGYTVMVADIVAEWADLTSSAGKYRIIQRRRLLTMAQAISKTHSALTGTGAQTSLSAPFGNPFATYAISVAGSGGIAATSWTVNLEGSLDGTNWTTICTHNATDGSTVWDTNGKAAHVVRANVSALTLGGATGIDVVVVAVP